MTPNQLATINKEHSHQRAVFAWANMAMRCGFLVANEDRAYTEAGYAEGLHGFPIMEERYWHWPQLDLMHAIPNGGKRDAITAGKLKAEGVKAGIPDIFLPVARSGYHGLYIELKKPKAEGQRQGVVAAVQTGRIADLRAQGYAVSVCFGWEAAVSDIQRYLQMSA